MKKLLVMIITGIMSFMLISGCSGTKDNPDLTDKQADVKETDRKSVV